ncbi:hypothetical protein BV898_16875 [Hypsibius exemplaris]|uniref:Glycosyltransferase family 92 protein n=1 Tax=Hypsibius exemplaris TaxID=2072580 RepID=A0A9X6NGQ4_HYPEX|nr:hypothetical protein BV898_16875 [Hypsibius exemplaris]
MIFGLAIIAVLYVDVRALLAGALEIRQPVLHSTKEKPRNLTICAIIRDEMPYILEWIEFYRLQGVEKFLLYDDGGIDDTVLIPGVFAARGLPDLIEIHPANPIRRNAPFGRDASRHSGTQMYVLDHCNTRCIGYSEWVVVVDVDEFIRSPLNMTLWEYICSKKALTEVTSQLPASKALSQFYLVVPARYGTSGMIKDFQGKISVNPYLDDSFKVFAHAGDDSLISETGNFPMIMQVNPNRAPESRMDPDFEERYSEICRNHADERHCAHDLGKSIWKPERCGVAGVHWCEENLIGVSYTPPFTDLRDYHYAFKAWDRVDNLVDYLKAFKYPAMKNFDKKWFSSRRDSMPKAVIEEVRRGLQSYF